LKWSRRRNSRIEDSFRTTAFPNDSYPSVANHTATTFSEYLLIPRNVNDCLARMSNNLVEFSVFWSNCKLYIKDMDQTLKEMLRDIKQIHHDDRIHTG